MSIRTFSEGFLGSNTDGEDSSASTAGLFTRIGLIVVVVATIAAIAYKAWKNRAKTEVVAAPPVPTTTMAEMIARQNLEKRQLEQNFRPVIYAS